MTTETDDLIQVRTNLAAVKAEIAAAAAMIGRSADAVKLVAVAKMQPVARVRAALDAGHRVFGENRVQEAEAKWPALKAAFPGVRLHLIGPLQTNKVRLALGLFDVIETVDRPKLARVLAETMAREGLRPDVLIQVNTGEEPQKHGVAPRDADAFIRDCIEHWQLPVTGLMCIPPVDEDPSLHFALLREIAKRNGLAELSMGMSSDYTIAVRFGATIVRVGAAIFGARDTSKPAYP
jgi:hypothetical protein